MSTAKTLKRAAVTVAVEKKIFCRKSRTHTQLHTHTQRDTQTVLCTVCLIRFFVHVRETITTKPQQLRIARVIKQTINELENICGNISSDIVKRPATTTHTHTHTHTRLNNVKTFVGQGVGSSTNQLRPPVRPFVCPSIALSVDPFILLGIAFTAIV